MENAGDGATAEMQDTLAWALFANGLDDDALAASAQAVDLASDSDRRSFQGFETMLEENVRQAQERGYGSQIAELETRRDTLRTEVEAQGGWRFENDEDQWWYEQLERLVSEIEAFADPGTGLVSGFSARWGWGIERRLEFARTIEERSVTGATAQTLWEEARAAIRESDLYDGLDLKPQLGLLPVGEDPDSGLWEFVHLQTGEPPRRGSSGSAIMDEPTGVVLVLVPGGTFFMGAQSGDPVGDNYDPQAELFESPVHEVLLDPYMISEVRDDPGAMVSDYGGQPEPVLAGGELRRDRQRAADESGRADHLVRG